MLEVRWATAETISAERERRRIRLLLNNRIDGRPCAGDSVILGPPLRSSIGRLVEDVLSIRQFVIVALSGILREILDELPIIALGIVEVHALAIRMRVRGR
jgi:hypothetical protein